MDGNLLSQTKEICKQNGKEEIPISQTLLQCHSKRIQSYVPVDRLLESFSYQERVVSTPDGLSEEEKE